MVHVTWVEWSFWQLNSCSVSETCSKLLLPTIDDNSPTTVTCFATVPDIFLNSGYVSTKFFISAMLSTFWCFFAFLWNSSMSSLMVCPISPKFKYKFCNIKRVINIRKRNFSLSFLYDYFIQTYSKPQNYICIKLIVLGAQHHFL